MVQARFRFATTPSSALLVSWLVLFGCVRPARGQADGDVPAILRAAFVAQRPQMVHRRVIVSPLRDASDRPAARWAPADLSLVLAEPAVRLADLGDASCPRPEPLMCVLSRDDVGVVFTAPRIAGDTARIRMIVLARRPIGSRFSEAETELTLIRRRGDWVVVARELLGTS
jgi:hypothetical protein